MSDPSVKEDNSSIRFCLKVGQIGGKWDVIKLKFPVCLFVCMSIIMCVLKIMEKYRRYGIKTNIIGFFIHWTLVIVLYSSHEHRIGIHLLDATLGS